MWSSFSLESGRSALGARRRGWAGVWLAMLLLGGAAAGPSRADMFTPGVKDQIKLGNQAAQQVMRQYRVVHDQRADELERVGHRLLDALPPKDRNQWDWHFYLIESKEINAFALPGGNTFFFTGLYDRLHTEDELAAVMGHEMTHVRKEHWAHMAGAAQKRELGLNILLGVTRAGRGWQTAAGLFDSMVNLRFSRKDEDQADAGGLQDMVEAGYNPQGMLDLFHVLQQAGGSGGPAFLADHPLTSTRIEHARQRIAEMNSSDFRPEVPLPGTG
jgi:beta-barrel assembly-enhancing protease